MAERNGSNFKTLQQAGEYGNACRAILDATFTGDAAADTVLLGHLPGGSIITGVTMVTPSLGAAQTMDVGYRYTAPAEGAAALDAFLNGVDTGTGGTFVFTGVATVADGCGIDIVATNVGAGAATGTASVVIDYVYQGQ
jgi:hypothetical protein